MNALRLILFVFLIALASFLVGKCYHLERQKRQLKPDLIELSDIEYGLFNVDEWKVLLADIITKKIESFELSAQNREQMRKKISGFLYQAINDFEQRFYQQRSKNLWGKIESKVVKAYGAFDTVKRDIPQFTEDILAFMDDKENRKAVRNYLVERLNEYANSTFSETDYSLVNAIVGHYEQDDAEQTRIFLKEKITRIEKENRFYQFGLLLVAISGILLILLLKNTQKYELLLLLLLSLFYLFLGVLLPMIEIDARITEMSFTLLDERISFTNQVLFYQSKSILEMVRLMMTQSGWDLLAVGVLVLTFSILFPLAKLVSSVIYLYHKRFRNNRFFQFMVLKSGKWSMADVMVVAIFMAYIGFDGIVSEQLKQLENLSSSLNLLTTNQSNLLFGFYSFLIFVLMSLLLSQKIQLKFKLA